MAIVSLRRKMRVSWVGTKVAQADPAEGGFGRAEESARTLSPQDGRRGVRGGRGHGDSAWEVPKTWRGPLRRRRHAVPPTL
jgi:hypothetical protein